MGARSGRAEPLEQQLFAGRYRVESLLGKGGMGAVYAVNDASTGDRLALKFTPHTQSAKVLELFRREFHTLHGLRHPNIIRVYDYGSDESGVFYTMELLEGGDLGNAAPLPWRQVCSYLRQVATLLGIIHARRLLHRDVTPRNIWVTPAGRLKMIDFGALCHVGVPTEIVGTPPFIAPEWISGRSAGLPVDQRADLFALGALGYWLLTSAHAYPARTMNDLARVWSREPAPPSSLARLVENRVLEPIPPELDALILSLLRKDPAARPESTEDLIDRIDAIAGPSIDPVEDVAPGQVRSTAFVGRQAEQRRIAESLRRDKGQAFAVEGGAGLGRSRLLEELSVVARLAGTSSLLVRAGLSEPAYGVASRIALGLFDRLPREAAAAAHGHETALAQLSPELQRRLGVGGTVARDPTPRGRDQLQRGLTQWLFALAERSRVMILVDDIEQCDEESSAWLAALAPYCAERPLLLVAALRDEPGVPRALHLQMLANASRRLPLPPLSAAETRELLHSAFGPATYLDRAAEVLHRVANGSPAHCLELVDHLVEHGLARFSEGRWILPGQLSDAELPRNRTQMHLARLDQLGRDARSLAEVASIHDGPLARAECLALSELNAHDTEAALVELTLLGILVESEAGYAFAHASVREQLRESLTPERRGRAHARLGKAMLRAAAGDAVQTLRAGLHVFAAGETDRGEKLIRDAALHILEARGNLHGAAPLLEQAVRLFRDAGLGPERLAAPLAVLGAASFLVDRRLADRYGKQAIEALETVLRFDIARKLKPRIGAHAALIAALSAAAGRRLANRKAGLSIKDALRALAGTAIALNGVATSSLDVEMTERCAKALEPLSGFSDRHIVGVVRRCVDAIGGLLQSDPAPTFQKLQSLCAHLESDTPIRGLPDALRREFLGGSLLTLGLVSGWRQDPAMLEIADRIEPFGPMYALNADQLRSMYYSNQGDRARAAHYQQCVETRALQAGAAWQIVALEPIGMSFNAFWSHDALQAKRAASELDRLTQALPTFRFEALRARGTYLVLTGRYREAIELLRASDESRAAGWSRGRAILARAHNRAGEHALARDVCTEALAGKSEEDLRFVLMYLHLQVELALAHAALGDFEAARALSDRLLARHAALGPIALGTLHEARARVALLERDFATCREHCAAMQRCFASTQIATLREVSESLAASLAKAERGDATEPLTPTALLADDAHLLTRVRLILTHTDDTFERRAQLALQIAFDLTGAETGFVLAGAAAGGLVSAGNETPPRELVQWAEKQLAEGDLDQTAVASVELTHEDTSRRSFGDFQYCVVPLGEIVGTQVAFVLGFRGAAARAPSPDVLAIIAEHLAHTQAED